MITVKTTGDPKCAICGKEFKLNGGEKEKTVCVPEKWLKGLIKRAKVASKSSYYDESTISLLRYIESAKTLIK